MLEHLLKLISFEKLIDSFKNQNLFEDFNLYHETYALRQAKVAKTSDSDILKFILPPEISKKMFGLGNLNLLAFIFALRHKILFLNSMFHLSSIKHKNSPLFQQTKDEFCVVFGEEFFEQYCLNHNMLGSNYWGEAKQLPIFGFSAIGCHFAMRDVSLCRAFDAYHIPYCKNVTTDVFCDQHKHEKFWHETISIEASIQTKMSQFYANTNNFSQFDEESLKQLINNFFHYFESSFKFSAPELRDTEKIKDMLKFYSFSSLEEIKQDGGTELRRRFLEMAKNHHPDIGGSQELFREAREHYEYLKEIIPK